MVDSTILLGCSVVVLLVAVAYSQLGSFGVVLVLVAALFIAYKLGNGVYARASTTPQEEAPSHQPNRLRRKKKGGKEQGGGKGGEKHCNRDCIVQSFQRRHQGHAHVRMGSTSRSRQGAPLHWNAGVFKNNNKRSKRFVLDENSADRQYMRRSPRRIHGHFYW